jgi:hypothetical protein
MLNVKKFTPRLIGAALIALGCLSAQNALAISTLPVTGVCGFAISGSYPFINQQLSGAPIPSLSADGKSQIFYPYPQATGSLNWLGTIDFAASTITVNIVSQTATNPNTNGSSTPTFVNTQQQVSVPFSVSSPSSGMYVLNMGNAGSINVIPVNNGNTILMQQFVSNSAGGKAGVCQF